MKQRPTHTIEPSKHFDVIISGTGHHESIIAAAAATTGTIVLHLNPDPVYCSHYASFLFMTSPLKPIPSPLDSSTVPDISVSTGRALRPLLCRSHDRFDPKNRCCVVVAIIVADVEVNLGNVLDSRSAIAMSSQFSFCFCVPSTQ